MKYPKRVSINKFKEQKKSYVLKKKIIGLLFLSGLTTGAYFFAKEDLTFSEDLSSTSSPTASLMAMMKYDFAKLKKSKSLPEALYEVQEIQFNNRSENLDLKNNELSEFINLKRSGKLKLVVEFYPFPEEATSHLVQFNWINVKSKDKIWEINRVYKLKKTQVVKKSASNKKKPDHY